MLNLHTDLKNISWLQYILEEFVRISGADFEIKIINNVESINEKNVIYYTRQIKSNSAKIPFKNNVLPNNNFQWKKEDFFVIQGTDIEDKNNEDYLLHYDVFWNAFVHLSRLEEWREENKGNLVHSYIFRHPRKDKKTFKTPIVNYYFNDLKTSLQVNFPELKFKKTKPLQIEWSHDLDYIKKTIQLRLKQTLLNGINIFKQKGLSKNLKRTISFLFSTPSYWCFDYWEELEKSSGVKSIYYIYAKHPNQKKGIRVFKSWLIDPTYDISKNVELKAKLKGLIKEGFKIGLHGSYFSAFDSRLLADEKAVLESTFGIQIEKTRQHWLNYSEKVTPKIHNHLFVEDSTVGWNDEPGFRAGTCSSYKPYNHENHKPFDYFIVPQVLMDSHIYDYNTKLDDALRLIKICLTQQNAKISVSWHPRTSSKDYKWHFAYEKILKLYSDWNIDKSKL